LQQTYAKVLWGCSGICSFYATYAITAADIMVAIEAFTSITFITALIFTSMAASAFIALVVLIIPNAPLN